jgi:mannan endo-1,4-beta-mannosidase
MRARTVSVLGVAVLATASLSAATLDHAARPAPSRDFVRVRDGAFVIGDAPYHYMGVNLWFGMNLGADGDTRGDRARLVRELDHLERLGVKNIRLMASSEGPATEPQRVVPAVQNEPGRYDERLLRGLDFLLAEMAKRDMRGVLILNNFFQWTGGMAQYVSWATGQPIPYPERDGHTWDEFQQFAARFYALDAAESLFERYVALVTARRNTITGVVYRDDPTIMAWQLSNEPRGFAYSDAYVAWVDRIGAVIRRDAPNQLISLGGEGKLDRGTPGTGTQFERVSRSPFLDYLTIHLWIENWGWFDPTRADSTWDRSIGRTMSYLADHVAIARAVNKPIVVEEFGVARDGRGFAPTTPVTYRDRYFRAVLEAVYYLASDSSTTVAGANVWSWSGEGTPVTPGAVWRRGDPWTGDPPHERQGWYSIYASDSSTLAIVATYARRMDGIGRPRTTVSQHP